MSLQLTPSEFAETIINGRQGLAGKRWKSLRGCCSSHQQPSPAALPRARGIAMSFAMRATEPKPSWRSNIWGNANITPNGAGESCRPLCRAMLTSGWGSAFAFPRIDAGIQLEDGDVFLMHLHLKAEYIISLLHVYFIYMRPYSSGDLCGRVTHAGVWDPGAQWAMILLFRSYLFA